nr:hypothetical protein [Streptomyces sp. SID4951]
MPLLLLSGVLLPMTLAPTWLRWVSYFNPLSLDPPTDGLWITFLETRTVARVLLARRELPYRRACHGHDASRTDLAARRAETLVARWHRRLADPLVSQ